MVESFTLEDMGEEEYQDLICRMYSALLYLARHHVGYCAMAEASTYFDGYDHDKDYMLAIREIYELRTGAFTGEEYKEGK